MAQCDAYRMRQEQAQIHEREAWERTRIQTWYAVQIQIERSGRQPIKKFMPFPWDRQDEEIDVEEMRKTIKQAKWIEHKVDAPQQDASKEEAEQSYDKFLNEWQALQS